MVTRVVRRSGGTHPTVVPVTDRPQRWYIFTNCSLQVHPNVKPCLSAHDVTAVPSLPAAWWFSGQAWRFSAWKLWSPSGRSVN